MPPSGTTPRADHTGDTRSSPGYLPAIVTGDQPDHTRRSVGDAAVPPADLARGDRHHVDQERAAAFFDPSRHGVPARPSPAYWRAQLDRLAKRQVAEDARLAALRETGPSAEGLSYEPYRAATAQDGYLTAEVRPGTVRVGFRPPAGPLWDAETGRLRCPWFPRQRASAARRGVVREFSSRSRGRLLARIRDLEAECITPYAMLTLTYPGNWRAVAPDGRTVKRHMKAFRKRWERFCRAAGVSAGALWFLEFQKRGAPHVHFDVWFAEGSVDPRMARKWLSRAWAEIVGAEGSELEKHKRAGTQLALLRHPDFRYAAKYASKIAQKTVPLSFAGVGRLWGTWGYRPPEPVTVSIRATWEEASALVDAVASRLQDYAPRFAGKLRERWAAVGERIAPRFAFHAWGPEAVATVCAWRWPASPSLTALGP